MKKQPTMAPRRRVKPQPAPPAPPSGDLRYHFRVADHRSIPVMNAGARVFSLAKASKRTGWPESVLQLLHDTVFEKPKKAGGFELYPELCEELGVHQETDESFTVYSGMSSDNWLARITVNPLIDAKGQFRLVELMSFAPLLWRALRKSTNLYLCAGSAEGLETLGHVLALLHRSGGRQPVGYIEDEHDDEVLVERSRAAMVAIGDTSHTGSKNAKT